MPRRLNVGPSVRDRRASIQAHRIGRIGARIHRSVDRESHDVAATAAFITTPELSGTFVVHLAGEAAVRHLHRAGCEAREREDAEHARHH